MSYRKCSRTKENPGPPFTCCWVKTPITSNHWSCWLGLVGVANQQHPKYFMSLPEAQKVYRDPGSCMQASQAAETFLGVIKMCVFLQTQLGCVEGGEGTEKLHLCTVLWEQEGALRSDKNRLQIDKQKPTERLVSHSFWLLFFFQLPVIIFHFVTSQGQQRD